MHIIVTGRMIDNRKIIGYKVWYVSNNILRYKWVSVDDINKISDDILNCKVNKKNGHLISKIGISITNYPTYSKDGKIIKMGVHTDSSIIAISLHTQVEYIRILICGALIEGAISDPYSTRANIHAELYYEEIRHRKDDIKRIAENTGYKEDEILEIKNYLFMDEHQLSTGYKRFDPSFHIAQSWQRLCSKDKRLIKKHDLTLLKHEMLELGLMKSGMDQDLAHAYAQGTFNYGKESDEYYDKIKKHQKKR